MSPGLCGVPAPCLVVRNGLGGVMLSANARIWRILAR
nr:MAG TPA: hypothetical protein [Caudoviricetes sp.]